MRVPHTGLAQIGPSAPMARPPERLLQTGSLRLWWRLTRPGPATRKTCHRLLRQATNWSSRPKGACGGFLVDRPVRLEQDIGRTHRANGIRRQQSFVSGNRDCDKIALERPHPSLANSRSRP